MPHTFVIVDDDENSLQVMQQALQFRYADARFHLARSGAECLEALRQSVPVAIFLDLSLPEMDGWQTLQAIRANPLWAALPVIAMTAYDSVNVAHDAMQAGFSAYVPKPVDLELLNQTIGQWVG